MSTGNVFFQAKAWNRRVEIIYFAEKDIYVMSTKRLVSREKRHITKTESVFSAETFALIGKIIQMLLLSPEYKTSGNRAWGRMERAGEISIATNMDIGDE